MEGFPTGHINETRLKGLDGFPTHTSQKVNGFHIDFHRVSKRKSFMTKQTYDKLVKAWLKPNMDETTFKSKCKKEMCPGWHRKDIYGGVSKGYWDYQEGTYEHREAYTLSKEYAIYRLSVLPYPRKVILKTIEIGCRNRLESVIFSNFLCDWVFREYKQIRGKELPLYQQQVHLNILTDSQFALAWKWNVIQQGYNSFHIMDKGLQDEIYKEYLERQHRPGGKAFHEAQEEFFQLANGINISGKNPIAGNIGTK